MFYLIREARTKNVLGILSAREVLEYEDYSFIHRFGSDHISLRGESKRLSILIEIRAELINIIDFNVGRILGDWHWGTGIGKRSPKLNMRPIGTCIDLECSHERTDTDLGYVLGYV